MTDGKKGSLSFILSESEEELQSAAVTLEAITKGDNQTDGNDRESNDTNPSGKRKRSKFCIADGCEQRAKHNKRCWKHGGYIRCKVSDCENKAKTRGVCWSHGGGTICSVAKCETISVSNGRCWAHGGGKRCLYDGCNKPAYGRTEHLCRAHYQAQDKCGTI